jgi:hypothetical protein
MISYSELMYLNSSATGKRGRLPGTLFSPTPKPIDQVFRTGDAHRTSTVTLLHSLAEEKYLHMNSYPEDLIWRYLGSF